MNRCRSHRYPDENYIDTTYFDKDEKSLDVAFKRMKVFNPKSYPDLHIIVSLYIDHNNLTKLPEPCLLPNLTFLNCSHNKLTQIDFYPGLTTLIISSNLIKQIPYFNSKLQHVDCSFNPGFRLETYLPECKNLYLTDCELDNLNLALCPKLEILDCENNKLTSLDSHSNLKELGIQNNLIQNLPVYPHITTLYADNNKLTKIKTYPELTLLSVSNNQISQIDPQPQLTKLYATNNQIVNLSLMPNLISVDVSYNMLEAYTADQNLEHVYLYFNPLETVNITFNKLKELKISFSTYLKICQTYGSHFTVGDIRISVNRLDQLLLTMRHIFSESLMELIKHKISKIKFTDRDVYLFKLSLLIYSKLFPMSEINSINELVGKKEFSRLLQLLESLYHKAMVIALYFNGYRADPDEE